MKFISLITLLIANLSLQAQWYDPENVSKKAKDFYNQAMERASDGNLADAASLLLQSVEQDKNYVDAYLSLGGLYSQLKNYPKGIEYYEKAIAIDSVYTIDYKLPYSISLAHTGEFEKALAAINDLLEKAPPRNENSMKAVQYRKRCYEFAVDYAKKNVHRDYVFSPINLGDSINSKESEYFPSLIIDGNELVFTRRLNNFNEDFFRSLKSTNWEKAKPLEGKVNTEQNEGAQNLSQDGEMLVFTGCNRPDGFGSCDIYISFLTDNNGWSEPQNLGGRVNSDQWDSQPCLSPDKQELYFASRRFGGYGGSDIYVSRRLPNGRWGEPENLGPNVNTPGDDQSPFIHADNLTLYFTSNYWPGYGDDDLFLVRREPGGEWSRPVNLGYPINTIANESTLFVAADGKTAYYASDRSDTRGGLDIYSFELREDVRPNKTANVYGVVYDSKTKKAVPSLVELIDLSTGKTVSKIPTDENNRYFLTLPVGKDYAFNVNRKGYLFFSHSFMLTRSEKDSSYQIDIELQPLEVNARITLSNVFFDVNKYELQPSSMIELDKVVQLMNENPTLRIEISGHTDNVGKPADNLKLSTSRAKAVVNYLTSKGIKANRLVAKGMGETQPVQTNETEEGRAWNRRTEMRVIGI